MAVSLSSSPFSFHSDASFEVLARRLKKAQAYVDVPLLFPQFLCLAASLPASLTPTSSFFRPFHDLFERLSKHKQIPLLGKREKALQKIEAIYRAFIEEICHAPNEKRAQLLEISPALLHQLIKYKHLESLQVLVDNQVRLAESLSPLHIAAQDGDEEMISWLVQAGAEKEAKDNAGRTPLHYAILRRQGAAVRQLIALGVDVKVSDINGCTPLHTAALIGELANVELLLSNGAAPFAVNQRDEAPFDLALKQGHDVIVLYLIDPTRFKGAPPLKSSDQDAEGFYYQGLENAYYEGEGILQLFYLHRMSELYLAKKQWITTAHLLNSTLTLANRLDLPQTYREYVLDTLERFEDTYLQEVDGLKTFQEFKGYVGTYRRHLQEIRQHIHQQLQKRVCIKKIQQELTKRLQRMMGRLIEETLSYLQEAPPTSFAVIGLGSMSRDEMAPYSDLELAILIEESTPTNKAYFRRLSELLALKTINVGETKYDLIRPRRVQHEMLPPQSLTPHGFSLDSGGLSPLGKAGVYELIGDPQEIAALQTDEWLAKHDGEIILVQALTTCCLIKGDHHLVEKYRQLVSNHLNTRSSQGAKNREIRALELLKGHLEEFRPFLEEGRLQLRAFDVKKDFYRPLHMFIGALGLYYGLKSYNTLDLVQELAKQRIISQKMAHNLDKTLRHVLTLRLRAQLFYREQKEIFYYPKDANDLQAAGLCLIEEKESQLALEIYRVLVPLQKLMQAFAQGDQEALTSTTCFDHNVGVRDNEAEKALNYEEAENAYLQRVVLNPHDLEALDDLQRIKMTLSQAKAALSLALDRLMVLKNRHVNKPHSEIAASLNNIGNIYLDLGETQQAKTYYEQSLAMAKQLYGDKPHSQIAISLNNLGNVYKVLEEMQTALTYYEQSLAMRKQLYGNKPHLEIAGSLVNLGNVYKSLGEMQKALNCHKQSLAMKKQLHFNKPHPTIANSLNNLGIIYEKLGEHQQAMAHYEQSLAIYKQLYGDKPHRHVADSLSNLGIVYEKLGKTREALACHEQGLAIYKELYGDKPHQHIASSCTNLGNVYMDLGKMQEALTCYDQSLAMYKQLYGDKPHSAIADSLNNLGNIYQGLGKIQQALTYCQQSLAMYKQLYGDKPHPSIADSLNNLGNIYSDLGKAQQALTYYEQSLAMYKQLYGDKPHPSIADSLNNLGNTYSILGKTQQALTYYEQSLAMKRQLYSDKPHSSIADSLNNLGIVYMKLGEIQQALTCIEQSLAIKKQLYGNKPHPTTASCLNSLGNVYKASGKIQQAITYYDQSLVMRKKLLGNKPHPEIANSLTNLARAYLSLGEKQQALSCHKQSLEMKKQLYKDKPHPAIAESLNDLASIYCSLGEIQQALTCIEQSLAICKRLYGDKPHPAIASCLNYLGTFHQALGDNQKAQTYFEQAKAMEKK